MSKKSIIGGFLAGVAASGLAALAVTIAKKRNRYIPEIMPDFLGHMPASLITDHYDIPEGFDVVADLLVVSNGGMTGVLVQCYDTGIFYVYNGKDMALIDQEFALEVAEDYEPFDYDDEDEEEEENLSDAVGFSDAVTSTYSGHATDSIATVHNYPSTQTGN